jgi:hypothetical protein
MRRLVRSGAAALLGAWLGWGGATLAEDSTREQAPRGCGQACARDLQECTQACKEHAGRAMGMCVNACRQAEKECQRECREAAHVEAQ